MFMIGIDPHKGSHTASAVDASEEVVAEIRVTADRHQRGRLLEWASDFVPRTWAVEGATGMGAMLAQQLVGAGEHVLDVPPKLSSRVRLLDNGRIDKTDPNDARSAAIVALRNATLKVVTGEDQDRVILRMLADRYHQLTAQRTRSVCRLHAVLCLVIEGGTRRSLTADKAQKLLENVEVSDPIALERVACCNDFITEIAMLDAALADARTRTVAAVLASKTTVDDLYGIGPIGAAIIVGRSGDIRRFQPPVTTPDTTAPRRSRHRRVPGRGIGSTLAVIVNSTMRSTPPRSPRSRTTIPAATTTYASKPTARPRRKRCAHSSGASATSSTASSSPTPETDL
jgi:transposase